LCPWVVVFSVGRGVLVFCAYSECMSNFVTREINQLHERLERAENLWNLSIAKERWNKLENLTAQIAVLRDLKFLLSMTKGLDVRLVLLDGLVQSTKDINTRPIRAFDRLYIFELARLLQRYQWHEDQGNGIGN
jgi:hypothetical protein